MPLSLVQPEHYEVLLSKKTKALGELMSPFTSKEPEVYASEPIGYRLRAECGMRMKT
jgi:tRNA/tmRNA/rRNA uracil-C5-methylase (TrmA/RlmC/RlmD family)